MEALTNTLEHITPRTNLDVKERISMHLEVVRHKALTQRTAGFLIPILRNLGIVNQKSGLLYSVVQVWKDPKVPGQF